MNARTERESSANEYWTREQKTHTRHAHTHRDSLTNCCFYRFVVAATIIELKVRAKEMRIKQRRMATKTSKKNTFGHFEYCKSHHKQIDYFFIIRFLFKRDSVALIISIAKKKCQHFPPLLRVCDHLTRSPACRANGDGCVQSFFFVVAIVVVIIFFRV